MLVSEPSPDPMKMGAALALVQDLSVVPSLEVSLAHSDSDAQGSGASEWFQITISGIQGRLHGVLTVTRAADQHTVELLQTDAPSFVGVVNGLAKSVDSRATAFSTENDAALRAYVAAVLNRDPAARLAGLETTVRMDPRFGLAYLELAQLRSANPQERNAVLDAANGNAASFTPLDRVRLEALEAAAKGLPLVRQADAEEQVVRAAPNDTDALARLGTDQFLLGDPAAGKRYLERALQLNPRSDTLRLQLANGLIAARQFRAAEEQLKAVPENPSAVPDTAMCALLAGDKQRADTSMQEFLNARRAAKDGSAPLLAATWAAITGSLDAGIGVLDQAQFASPDLMSIANSQKAIWQLAEGKPADAQRSLLQGMNSAASPVARAYAVAAVVDAAGGDMALLQKRVQASPLAPQLRESVMAYALFFARNYSAAADVWRTVLAHTGERELSAKAMLASSLERAGRSQEAAKMQVMPFVPAITGGDPYAAISFNEMRRLLKL